MNEIKRPNVVGGSYFTYQGVKYGVKTRVKFTKEFYARAGVGPEGIYINRHNLDANYQFIGTTWFQGIWKKDGRTYLNFCFYGHMTDIEPDRDIAQIVSPVYYYDPPTPKEIRQKRLKNGTWFLYIWDITLWYILALIISPIFQQWYLIWTMGMYIYLRFCWIRLSTPDKDDFIL